MPYVVLSRMLMTANMDPPRDRETIGVFIIYDRPKSVNNEETTPLSSQIGKTVSQIIFLPSISEELPDA